MWSRGIVSFFIEEWSSKRGQCHNIEDTFVLPLSDKHILLGSDKNSCITYTSMDKKVKDTSWIVHFAKNYSHTIHYKGDMWMDNVLRLTSCNFSMCWEYCWVCTFGQKTLRKWCNLWYQYLWVACLMCPSMGQWRWHYIEILCMDIYILARTMTHNVETCLQHTF